MTRLSATDWREMFLELGQKWAALLEHYDLAEDAQPEDIIEAARGTCPHCGGTGGAHHAS